MMDVTEWLFGTILPATAAWGECKASMSLHVCLVAATF
jgi:hypothetical protein